MFRRDFLKFSGYLLGFLGISSLSFGEKQKISNKKLKISNNIIVKKDKKGNYIYYKNYSTGHECWRKFDENNNIIYFKNSFGEEEWQRYDKNNRLIYHKYSNHYKKSKNYEYWYKYDKNKKQIKITNSKFFEK